VPSVYDTCLDGYARQTIINTLTNLASYLVLLAALAILSELLLRRFFPAPPPP
jgi:hypothetical protein